MSICGTCDSKFETDEAYINHFCATTGHTPADPEHHGPEFVEIQKSALERAKQRDEVDNARQDEAIATLGQRIEAPIVAEMPPIEPPVYPTT